MRRYWLGLLFFSGVVVGQPKEYSVKEITDRMQKKYESIQDASARFTQHVRFGFSKIEQSFAGTLKMKKPNRYRVETEYQTLVTDGTTVWSFSPVNKQVLIDRYKETPDSFTPEQFLLNLPSNYYATLLQPESGSEKSVITLKLVPKDDQSFIKSMKVWVDGGSWVVKKVEMLDVNDTEKTYTVQEIKINTNLRDTTFVFTPPLGTEVVDLR
ncbi:MAG: outer membrane lipoprotein chaperone LolA [Ignavibacteria bacterium]|jgi:outer membrane lipoprotein carrier protein|nr:outer membrane lipoprotein chaperone LolA [Ignavibacteria bacterium]